VIVEIFNNQCIRGSADGMGMDAGHAAGRGLEASSLGYWRKVWGSGSQSRDQEGEGRRGGRFEGLKQLEVIDGDFPQKFFYC